MYTHICADNCVHEMRSLFKVSIVLSYLL